MENNIESLPKKMKWRMWKKRTSVEKILFAVIIIFFIVFIIMLGLLLHNYLKKKIPVCLTPICKEEAGRILRIMDLSVKPCDNFYNFACGNFMKYRAMRSYAIDYFGELDGYMDYRFKEIIESPVNDSEPRFVKRLKTFYQSCMDEKPSIKEVFDFYLNVTKLGEWSMSTSEKFSPEELMAKRKSSLLFYIYAHYESGYFKHIKIYDGSTITSDYVKANMTDEDMQYLRDRYLMLFGYIFPKLKMKDRNVEKYIEEMIDLELSLGKIMREEREDNATEITLSELQSNCSQINWTSYFRTLYTDMDHADNFSDSLPLKVNSMEYIKALCQLRADTSNRAYRALNNLIIWNEFVNTLVYVNEDIRDIKNNILEEPTAERKIEYWNEEKRWQKCLNNFNGVFILAQQNILLKAEENLDEIFQSIETFVKGLMKTADNTFAKANWLDKVSRNFTRFKVKSTVAKIGYDKELLDEEKINHMFDAIKVTDNYLQTIFDSKNILYKAFFFNETLAQHFKFEGIKHPFMANAFFTIHYGKETIIFPLGIFQPPFYAYKAPNYLNYGGIGFIIGHEIFHAFDSLERTYDDDTPNEVKPPSVDWPEEFLNEYKKRKECLVNQYSQFPLNENLTLDGNNTIEENIADVEGVIFSFRAYEDFIKKHGEEPSLPGLDYSNKQMFFIRYAQVLCSKQLYSKQAFRHSPGIYRVLGPLMNFQDFSQTFNCPSNSFMSPEQRCKLFG